MGITDVVVKVNLDLTGLPDPWKESTLRAIAERLQGVGLKVVGFEGDPFDMTRLFANGYLKALLQETGNETLTG